MYSPVEVYNCDGQSDYILICEHASNFVPLSVCGGDLGLSPEDMKRHIAYDIGAREVTLQLAKILNARAVLACFSRLVVDGNRSEQDPSAILSVSDKTLIPANQELTPSEVETRFHNFHRPFHAEISKQIERTLARGGVPRLVGLHSFTPQLAGGAPRPWHVAVLWHEDDRLSKALLDKLSEDQSLCVGDNEPYIGYAEGDTMNRHALKRGFQHVLFEVRQDLISQAEGQRDWAKRLGLLLTDL